MTNTEKEFYLDFDGNIGIPRCNPVEIIEQDKRTILKFSLGKIDMPRLSFLGTPEMTNNYAELVANDGTNIKLTCGEYEDATYNSGDPLPARFNITSVNVDGEELGWKYVDPWYPWVKYDLESVAYKLYSIYEEEHGRLSS